MIAGRFHPGGHLRADLIIIGQAGPRAPAHFGNAKQLLPIVKLVARCGLAIRVQTQHPGLGCIGHGVLIAVDAIGIEVRIARHHRPTLEGRPTGGRPIAAIRYPIDGLLHFDAIRNAVVVRISIQRIGTPPLFLSVGQPVAIVVD